MNLEFLAKMNQKILNVNNMSNYKRNLIEVIENLEKTIKKGGNENQINVLKRKVVLLKKELLTK